MRRGAAITGTVKAGGKAAKGARIVAANTAEQSFEVKANGKGQFALGGLPAGSYSVFTYDRTKNVRRQEPVGAEMKAGQAENVAINLKKKAGRLLVDLYAGSAPLTGPTTVTVVSRANGQFWSAHVRTAPCRSRASTRAATRSSCRASATTSAAPARSAAARCAPARSGSAATG